MTREVPPDVSARQARASNPDISAFVAANAGSGKTHVLVHRVIRLMLSGVAPDKILCITFTKAAAANMAERVFTTLGQWVKFDDETLGEAICATGLERIDRATLRRARELFAAALETPGGLKVQTIHALCTRLLQQFPFEANVAAHFAVLDDADQNEMMERASLGVLLEASANPGSAIGNALSYAMSIAADVTFRDMVRAACLDRDLLAFATQADPNAVAALLSRTIGVALGDDAHTLDQAIVEGPYLPSSQWDAAATAFMQGSAADQKQADRLKAALAAQSSERIGTYLDVFFTADGPRASPITKALRGRAPDLADAVDREVLRLGPILERRKAVALRDRSQALITIASEVARRYRAEKDHRGLLDYDDLIAKTLAMLERMPGSWVHYKLDRGIDHVLIDEAQDTSPRQWQIITRLVEEFFAGEGARDGQTRTLFAVGDEKQSIFSFQGAVMREFDERRRRFESRFQAASLIFDTVRFNYSFRSGAGVLSAVDSTFSRAEVFRSVTSDSGGMEPHNALPDATPGIIELWELETPDPQQDIEGWRAPFDAVEETRPEVRLAQRIARNVGAMIAGETVIRDGKPVPITAGDVLILVRRRGVLFESIIQALKKAQIDVAGADRLKLTEHIAVIDLMALADALLLPQDDLALAVALKSPLFGLTDDHLMQLAPGRKGSLRDALRERAGDLEFAPAWRKLLACEQEARGTPFAFYAWLLGGAGGRAEFLRRLGPEANDALDEFLELALSYEMREAASLQGFMHWLRSADIEIKRDMDVARSEVRVMTVHGAKGLEAPVVILADTTMLPQLRDRLLRIPATIPDAPPCVVWAGRQADDPPALLAARQQAKDELTHEYRRLLYVAMTRAASRLIVAGHVSGRANGADPNSWYGLISHGLENSDLLNETLETADGPVHRFRKPEDVLPPRAEATATSDIEESEPAWLRRHTPSERSPAILRPSDADEAPAAGATFTGSGGDARRRGIMVHRLLQSLPDVAPDRRADAAASFLARHVADWPDETRTELAQRTLALIHAFAPLFGPGSSAEVPLVGRVALKDGTPVGVSGQIDRLVISEREILIADFKTTRTPPGSVAETPKAYLRQLALYRALLLKLYPERRVRAALVWTETPEMMELSQAALDAELLSITSA